MGVQGLKCKFSYSFVILMIQKVEKTLILNYWRRSFIFNKALFFNFIQKRLTSMVIGSLGNLGLAYIRRLCISTVDYVYMYVCISCCSYAVSNKFLWSQHLTTTCTVCTQKRHCHQTWKWPYWAETGRLRNRRSSLQLQIIGTTRYTSYIIY